jgi:signal transduction histidine kinase
VFKDRQIQIAAEDSGDYILEEIRGKLFTPLIATKSKGQGFDLAVVKRLVESQGITITFESKMGKGTKFILQFPVA